MALNYQGRLFIPTDSDERDKGFLSSYRNYFTGTLKVSDALSLSASLAPQLTVYSKAGHGKSANKGLLENMVIVDATVKIIGPVSLYFPIILQTAKYQNFAAGAKRNDQLVHSLWIWPELGVDVVDNHTVGLSFRSASFGNDDLSGLALDKGINGGVAQLYYTGTF